MVKMPSSSVNDGTMIVVSERWLLEQSFATSFPDEKLLSNEETNHDDTIFIMSSTND